MDFNKGKKMRAIVIGIIVMLTCVVMCSAATAEPVTASFSSQMAEAFGRDALDHFMKDSGNVVKLHITTSGVCLERLKNGLSSLAGTTKRLSQADKDSGLMEIALCKDPLSVIVNTGCKVKNLTLGQLRDIFSNKINNWRDVGGEDLPIVLVIPSKNTGAYQNFKQLVMGSQEIKEDLIAVQAYMAVTGVRNIPGAISFISNSLATATARKTGSGNVSTVSIDGISPNQPTYPFHQTFSLVIRNDQNQVTRDAVRFMLSDKIKKRILSRGMTPIAGKVPRDEAR
jgi:phosphate transport system substrate-binding protein